MIAADPPWEERGGGVIKRGADRHYPLMPTKELPRVMRGSGLFLPFENAHLHLWYTDNFLEDALWLVRELGFAYVRTFTWVKTRAGLTDEQLDAMERGEAGDEDDVRMGIGQYARSCKESWLFCVRGKGQSPDVWMGDRGVRDVVFAPHVVDASGGRVHSAKPARAYERMERVSKGPRLEMFARQPRIDCTGHEYAVWGNEVT